MMRRNLNLLFRKIAAHLNKLHSVEQRCRNRVQVVSCSNEHHMRQIVVNIEEVIVKSIVLLGVEDFEQSRRRVTVICHLAYLIYLVENEDGVGRTSLEQALDDTSRHSTDVRLAMASYFRLVMHSA